MKLPQLTRYNHKNCALSVNYQLLIISDIIQIIECCLSTILCPDKNFAPLADRLESEVAIGRRYVTFILIHTTMSDFNNTGREQMQAEKTRHLGKDQCTSAGLEFN